MLKLRLGRNAEELALLSASLLSTDLLEWKILFNFDMRSLNDAPEFGLVGTSAIISCRLCLLVERARLLVCIELLR